MGLQLLLSGKRFEVPSSSQPVAKISSLVTSWNKERRSKLLSIPLSCDVGTHSSPPEQGNISSGPTHRLLKN